MADDILQRFLTKRLFDVGGDDARLERIRAATGDLADILKAAPERIAAFTMVAIDTDISPDEPLLAEVAAVLQKQWQSYAGAFVDATLPVIFRAMILSALEKLINSEAIAACVIMTARNSLPHLAAAGDADLWRDLIDKASHRLELRARRDWALPSAAAAERKEFVVPEWQGIEPALAGKDWLTTQLRAAGGPNNPQGEQTNGNPVWPNSNDGWVHEFAPRAANAIISQVNELFKRFAKNLNEQKGMQSQAEALSAYIQEIAAGLSQTSIGLERRSALIWWKEALYSPLVSESYRSLDLPVAAVLVAIDASAQTGAFAPRMAEAFLLEVVRAIDPEAANAPRKVTELCEALAAADDTVGAALKAKLSAVHIESGRTPLASLLGAGIAIDGQVLKARTGLASDLSLTPAEFSLWLFRDLQADAATLTMGPRKKRKAS